MDVDQKDGVGASGAPWEVKTMSDPHESEGSAQKDGDSGSAVRLEDAPGARATDEHDETEETEASTVTEHDAEDHDTEDADDSATEVHDDVDEHETEAHDDVDDFDDDEVTTTGRAPDGVRSSPPSVWPPSP